MSNEHTAVRFPFDIITEPIIDNTVQCSLCIVLLPISTAAKGYDCAFCDKSTNIGTLVVLHIKPGTHRYRYGNRPPS